MYKKDYSSLFRMQDNFFRYWGALNLPFYLTGGTALGRFYLDHRYSEDLDFFVNAHPDFSKLIITAKNALERNFKLDISKVLVTEDFARFFIEEGENFLKVEFVNDLPYRLGETQFVNKIAIDSVANILVNKLTAISGRDEPKDIFDIVFIALNYSFDWRGIFLSAKEKAMVNELEISRRLGVFPMEMLQEVDWFKGPFDKDLFKQHLNQIADDFILGRENSLGKDKTDLVKAEPKTNMSI